MVLVCFVHVCATPSGCLSTGSDRNIINGRAVHYGTVVDGGQYENVRWSEMITRVSCVIETVQNSIESLMSTIGNGFEDSTIHRMRTPWLTSSVSVGHVTVR